MYVRTQNLEVSVRQTERFNLRLHQETLDKLRLLAVQTSLSMSEIIRRLVERTNPETLVEGDNATRS